ncbi:MAG: HAMP domain-containing histidine kinase, partial [Anaerolineae bacterium]|nr:HAMP domain-containing histidine kinase [Anaerolineae bacterium]
RQPLAAMSTSLDFVLRYQDRITAERSNEKLLMVQKQVQRMAVLIEDALRFSKADAQKTEFAPQMLDARESCEHILEPIRMANAKNHQIIFTSDEGQVLADPGLLDHILTNLLTNAQKYSPENSTITVTLAREADCWLYSVTDQGIGIPEADVLHLFEPFYRASNAPKHAGTGLGLSIVKDYVEMHGGTLSISTVENEGTTFSFTLPIARR